MIRDQAFSWGFLVEIQKLFIDKELILHDKHGNEVHRGTCVSVDDINRDTERELFNHSWVVRIKFKAGAEYILNNTIHWDGEKLLALTKSHDERTFSVVGPAKETPAEKLAKRIKESFVGKDVAIANNDYKPEYRGTLEITSVAGNYTVKILVKSYEFKSEYVLDASDYRWTDAGKLVIRTTGGTKIISLDRQTDSYKVDGYKSYVGKTSLPAKTYYDATANEIKIVPRKGLKPGLQLVSLKGRKGVAPALR